MKFLPYILMTVVILLAAVLAARVSGLYKNFVTTDNCLKQAVDFSYKQLNLLRNEQSSNKEICLYLIGAIEFLGKQHSLTVQQRRILTIKVLKSCLGISAKELSRHYSEAVNRAPHSNQETTIRKGAKAAKNWLLKQGNSSPSYEQNQLSGLQFSAS